MITPKCGQRLISHVTVDLIKLTTEIIITFQVVLVLNLIQCNVLWEGSSNNLQIKLTVEQLNLHCSCVLLFFSFIMRLQYYIISNFSFHSTYLPIYPWLFFKFKTSLLLIAVTCKRVYYTYIFLNTTYSVLKFSDSIMVSPVILVINTTHTSVISIIFCDQKHLQLPYSTISYHQITGPVGLHPTGLQAYGFLPSEIHHVSIFCGILLQSTILIVLLHSQNFCKNNHLGTV